MDPSSPETPDQRRYGALDDARRRQILAIVAAGSSRRVAADYVGCAPSTITRTAQRDPEFAEQLARAEQHLEIEALRCIRKAASKPRYWRAAAWLLERKNRDDFAPFAPPLISYEQAVSAMMKILGPLDDAVQELVLRRLDEVLGNVEESRDDQPCIAAPAPMPAAPHDEDGLDIKIEGDDDSGYPWSGHEQRPSPSGEYEPAISGEVQRPL